MGGPTERGRKHLAELIDIVKTGERATLFFVIARDDVEIVHPADDVDPAYGEALRAAMDAGVNVVCWTVDIDGRVLRLGHQGTVLRRAAPPTP